MNTLWSALLIFALRHYSVAPAGAEAEACEVKFEQLNSVSRDSSLSNTEVREEVGRTYHQLYRSVEHNGRTHASEDARETCLRFRFRAAHIANFYTNDASYLTDMKNALALLDEMNAVKDIERADLFRALIGKRLFDEARRYLVAHPSLDVEKPVPRVAPEAFEFSGPTAFALSGDDDALQAVQYKLNSGRRLVVVAHPLCSFSRQAMVDLRDDDDFALVLKDTIWLAPVEQRIHLNYIRDWNRAQSTMQVVIARYQQDWPFIDDWSTPVFYLLDEGTLVGKVVGWPENGNKEALIRLLSAEPATLQESSP